MQGCNNVKCMSDATLSLSLGAHCYCKKSLSLLTVHSFAGCSSIAWSMATPTYNTTLAHKSSRMSSTRAQLSPNLLPNAWLGTSTVLSLGTWPSISTNSSCCSSRRNVFPVLHHTDISDQAGHRIILRRHYNNVIIHQELRAGRKPFRQEIFV